jgi:hypothetical protein
METCAAGELSIDVSKEIAMRILVILLSSLPVLLTSCASKEASPASMKFKEVSENYEISHAKYFYSLTHIVGKDPDCQKVVPLADKLLIEANDFKSDWNYGNAIFVANMAKGYCSIVASDVEAAKHFLILAGGTPGSPQLDTFGLSWYNADTRLLDELLKKKEQDAVIAFLESIKKFWMPKYSEKPIAKWEAEIKSGQNPNFKEKN